MFFKKIICLILLGNHVIHYSTKSQVAARMFYEGDLNNSDNRLVGNCLGHDEVNRFIAKHISEEQLADLLLAIVRTRNQNTQQHKQQSESTAITTDATVISINNTKMGRGVETVIETGPNNIDLKFIVKESINSNDQNLFTNTSTDPTVANTKYNIGSFDKKYNKFYSYRQKTMESNAYKETQCKSVQTELTQMRYEGHDRNFINCNDVRKTTKLTAVENFQLTTPIASFDNTTAYNETINLILDAIEALKLVKSAVTESAVRDKATDTEAHMRLKKEPVRKNASSDFVGMLTLLDLMTNIISESKEKSMRSHDKAPFRRSAPTCPYTPHYGSTPKYKPFNYTGTLVTSCYVCGLEEHEIPTNTICEDAFSNGDSFQEYQYRFKKNCRYDHHTTNYCADKHDPYAVWGRWTGGCSVRRMDISGIYTQRTCRNRWTPTMGNHFASHRMAKLELGLSDINDGCILSPGASLIPLSRSVSLYARFTACVCSGDLCNVGIPCCVPSYEICAAICIIPILLKILTCC